MYLPFSQSPFKESFKNVNTKVLNGHKKRVYSLDWNEDGTKLASGSVDTTIRVWSLEADKSTELKGHSESVLEVKFFNNNEDNLLVSCGADKKIKLWDIRMGKCANSEKSKTGCKNLKITPTGTEFVFSGKDDDILTFFDMRKFSQTYSIGFKDKINDFEYDRTNSYFLVINSKGNLIIYETNKIESDPLSVIEVSGSSLNALKIDNFNKIFATGGEDASIVLWDLEEMMNYKIIKKSDSAIKKLSFSHDTKLISAAYEGQNLDIFDVNNGENIYSIYSDNQFYSQCWNPKSYTLAFSGIDRIKSNQEEGGINIINI